MNVKENLKRVNEIRGLKLRDMVGLKLETSSDVVLFRLLHGRKDNYIKHFSKSAIIDEKLFNEMKDMIDIDTFQLYQPLTMKMVEELFMDGKLHPSLITSNRNIDEKPLAFAVECLLARGWDIKLFNWCNISLKITDSNFINRYEDYINFDLIERSKDNNINYYKLANKFTDRFNYNIIESLEGMVEPLIRDYGLEDEIEYDNYKKLIYSISKDIIINNGLDGKESSFQLIETSILRRWTEQSNEIIAKAI